jgi:hypothetical protein
MRRSLIGRVDGLERKKAPVRATRYVFLDDGETVDAHRNRMIASGQAGPTDRFIAFHWLPREGGGGLAAPAPRPSIHAAQQQQREAGPRHPMDEDAPPAWPSP